MKEGNRYNQEYLPNLLYYTLPLFNILVPAPPNWTYLNPPRNYPGKASTDFLLQPVNENEASETGLLVSILPRFYNSKIHGDAEEFVINQLSVPMSEIALDETNYVTEGEEENIKKIINEEVIPTQNGQFLTAQVDRKSYSLDFEKEFPPQWVYRSISLNTKTGTVYSNSFHTNLNNMLRYSRVAKMMIDNIVYNVNQ